MDADAGYNKRKIIAFVGGLDLCDGRYDTPYHPLFRTLQTVHKDDYHNPTYTVVTYSSLFFLLYFFTFLFGPIIFFFYEKMEPLLLPTEEELMIETFNFSYNMIMHAKILFHVTCKLL